MRKSKALGKIDASDYKGGFSNGSEQSCMVDPFETHMIYGALAPYSLISSSCAHEPNLLWGCRPVCNMHEYEIIVVAMLMHAHAILFMGKYFFNIDQL